MNRDLKDRIGGIPIHDHMNWLSINLIRYNLRILPEKLKNSIRSRIPWDLHVNHPSLRKDAKGENKGGGEH